MDPNTVWQLLRHRGHSVSIYTYGATDENVTLECEDCMEVVITQDIDAEMEAAIEALQP